MSGRVLKLARCVLVVLLAPLGCSESNDSDGMLLSSPDEPSGMPPEPAAGTERDEDPVDPSPADQAEVSGDGAQQPDSVANVSGEELYGVYCAPCHGTDANGGELGPEVRHPPDELARWLVRNGRSETPYPGPMIPLSSEVLSEPALDAILQYLSSFPQPDTGEGLYIDYCANCHGSDARGGPVAKHIAGKDEFQEVLRRGKGGQAFNARSRYMPSWQALELSDQEVLLLESYVGSLEE